MHQVGKKDHYYIRMHGQQNIKICLMMFVVNIENFQTNSTLHSINTRHKNQLHRLTVNLSCIQKGVSYSCINLLNSLPSNILKLQNKKSNFKFALCRYLTLFIM